MPPPMSFPFTGISAADVALSLDAHIDSILEEPLFVEYLNYLKSSRSSGDVSDIVESVMNDPDLNIVENIFNMMSRENKIDESGNEILKNSPSPHDNNKNGIGGSVSLIYADNDPTVAPEFSESEPIPGKMKPKTISPSKSPKTSPDRFVPSSPSKGNSSPAIVKHASPLGSKDGVEGVLNTSGSGRYLNASIDLTEVYTAPPTTEADFDESSMNDSISTSSLSTSDDESIESHDSSMGDNDLVVLQADQNIGRLISSSNTSSPKKSPSKTSPSTSFTHSDNQQSPKNGNIGSPSRGSPSKIKLGSVSFEDMTEEAGGHNASVYIGSDDDDDDDESVQIRDDFDDFQSKDLSRSFNDPVFEITDDNSDSTGSQDDNLSLDSSEVSGEKSLRAKADADVRDWSKTIVLDKNFLATKAWSSYQHHIGVDSSKEALGGFDNGGNDFRKSDTNKAQVEVEKDNTAATDEDLYTDDFVTDVDDSNLNFISSPRASDSSPLIKSEGVVVGILRGDLSPNSKSRKKTRRLKFSENLISDVFNLGRENFNRNEADSMFFSHLEQEKAKNLYFEEMKRAKNQGEDWNDWVYKRSDEDALRDEEMMDFLSDFDEEEDYDYDYEYVDEETDYNATFNQTINNSNTKEFGFAANNMKEEEEEEEEEEEVYEEYSDDADDN